MQFLISVIVAIYNTETYLRECLDSIITQSIGFRDKIQLILVNDGSLDNSELICLDYQSQFPDNVVYIKSENRGPSVARNLGIPFIAGRFVNFLDSDDKWDPTAFEILLSFFLNNYESVDVVAARVQFFEAQTSFHPLDYKYKRTRVVNLLKDYDHVHLQCTSTILKTSAIEKLQFNPDLTVSEDYLFLNTILLRKCRMGVVREARYFYRKRRTSTSQIQTSRQNPHFYFSAPQLVYQHLIDLSRTLHGSALAFIQYGIMYDLQWRIRNPSAPMLSTEEYQEYVTSISTILKQIDDYIIWKQRNLNENLKIICLSEKYGYDIRTNLTLTAAGLKFNNIIIFPLSRSLRLIQLCFLTVDKDTIILEARDNSWLARGSYTITARVNGISYNSTVSYYEQFNTHTLFGTNRDGQTVRFDLPMKQLFPIQIEFFFTIENTSAAISVAVGRFFCFSSIPYAYATRGSYLIELTSHGLIIHRYRTIVHIRYEILLLRYLLSIRKYRMVLIRCLYWLLNNSRRRVWLIYDRVNRADDSGKYLFEYSQDRIPSKTKIYYCISKSSTDYHVMKRTGPVLDIDSMLFKIAFLLSDKVISTQANEFYMNPFGQDKKYVQDLFQFDFVFLQHGVTKDDLSAWSHRYNKNIKLFIATAYQEYQSLLSPSYGYSPEVVKLLGFPRYDHLLYLNQNYSTANPKKIIILPTWRNYLTKNRKTNETDTYYPDLKNTEYYHFYNELINNNRLCEEMRKYNYTGLFGLHPNFVLNYVDFSGNDVFQILSGFIDYQPLFASSSLLVTDYSSVAFDFALLKKPIIYSQFDKNTFFQYHTYKQGYFDYQKYGFGPVCYNIESTVTAIIETIHHNCQLSDVYLNRVTTFFTFFDQNNTARVLDAIRELSPSARSVLPVKTIIIVLVSALIGLLLWILKMIRRLSRFPFLSRKLYQQFKQD